MGREIRRVPLDWEHPKDSQGHYRVLYDQTYEEALADWQREKAEWDADPEEREHAAKEYDCHSFEEWHGPSPDPDYYRPAFVSEATAYQIYENVSEGTPVSPVFESLDALIEWLVEQGHSRHAAESFAEAGYVPSFLMDTKKGILASNIHIFDYDRNA